MASDSGTAPSGSNDQVLAASEAIATRLVQALSATGYRFTARYNDLALDGVVCDLGKPFTIRGTSETPGMLFSMTPKGAGGVPRSGGGTYVQNLDGAGGGTLAMAGKWQIKTQVGVFGGSGTIPGRLAPASGG